MSFLLTCTRKDLRRRLADPMALGLWLVIPLLVGGLMTLVFGGQNDGPPQAKVFLVDEDDSVFGQLLAAVAENGGGDLLDVERVTRADGHTMMDAGEASAMVILPSGFSEAVLRSETTSLALVRNPAQIIMPGIIQAGLEILVEAINYLQQLFAAPLHEILGATPQNGGLLSSDAVAGFSRAVNDRLASLQSWLFPPALSVEFVNMEPVSNDGSESDSFNIGALFLPSMMFMAVLFIAQGMADDLWDEKDAGTLRRVLALPRSLSIFLAAKLMTAAAIIAVVGVVGLTVLRWMDVVTLARMPLALAWMTFGGTAVYCYFLVLQFLASTRRGASVLANVVLFPMMMIGGAFFPFEAMPPWMRAVGQWTPNGQTLVKFKEIIAGTASLEGVAVAAVAIGLPAALAFLISARLLAGRFASRA